MHSMYTKFSVQYSNGKNKGPLGHLTCTIHLTVRMERTGPLGCLSPFAVMRVDNEKLVTFIDRAQRSVFEQCLKNRTTVDLICGHQYLKSKPCNDMILSHFENEFTCPERKWEIPHTFHEKLRIVEPFESRAQLV